MDLGKLQLGWNWICSVCTKMIRNWTYREEGNIKPNPSFSHIKDHLQSAGCQETQISNILRNLTDTLTHRYLFKSQLAYSKNNQINNSSKCVM